MNSKVVELLKIKNEPSFRIKQIEEAYYKKSLLNAEDITVISKELREDIKKAGGLSSLTLIKKQVSNDGTIKCLFELIDGKQIESVLMKYKTKKGPIRNTLCISSQAGCAMKCSFCATGTLGLKRNLTYDEIVDQVVFFNHNIIEARIDNVVFMGMGEPLHNYDNVMKSVSILNEKVGIGARHITISTCGIIPNILKLADEPFQVNLAISLHSPYDDQRSEIMPVNKSFPLPSLIDAVKQYIEKTNRRVSFEYIMLGNFNDSVDAAEDLGHMLEPLRLAHVNLIAYNPTKNDDGTVKYEQSSNNQIHRFADKLQDCGVKITIRHNKGRDIDGACGQLAGKKNY
ncbi:MAG: 23S rRNA (adenine(2503)-C(2))-methyltransferase RlmN [bacterium]